ncbi:MAG: TraR/DksA family transcriptional regulator [Wenzhouxiangellaceae bacterium]
MIALDEWKTRIEALIAELRALSEQSTESRKPVELDQTLQGRLSRMDAMQGQATEARRQRQIAALNAALTRIENGLFGECSACGEPIAEGRLKSNPAVLLCVDCVSAAE